MSHSTTTRSATETRALDLLGTGTISIDAVAAACGVTSSRISQLLADPDFADEVSKRRVASLQKHNARDNEYDVIEDKLMEQFKNVMPLMMRPHEILKGIQIINAAKRRGSGTVDSMSNSGSVNVTINLPTKIIQTFTTNTNNQVIQAGTQELLTVQSGRMNDLLTNRNKPHVPQISEVIENGVSDENGYQRNGNGTNQGSGS